LISCPSCAFEAPDDFAFCPKCGRRLVSLTSLPEERKVVTILFCDLVSYTAHSEAADHELIDDLLRRYGGRARRLVEAHGGVVEKFIGDAVVAVFGFPHAHDDDAERAVLAGLRLVHEAGALVWPDGDPAQVRVGVNSGETYLHITADPASGEALLAGDAVNTAARLQAAAPPGGVVVGALTHELTRHVVHQEELEPLHVKGKREAVEAWLATGPKKGRSRAGLRTAGLSVARFLGRESELAAMHEALHEASEANEGRFVLLVGEPGIGKSRLVLEFAHALQAAPGIVTWRQGRCLPYGEGVTFSALGEILKEHAGIFDSDDITTVEAKLEAVLPDGEDRSWLRRCLRPLLGLDASPASREENFAAWTRFLELLAGAGPTVLVLEDMHWAGEAMLAFVDHLVSRDLTAPILIIATTRPELLHQHAGVMTAAGEGARRRLTVSSLSADQVRALIEDMFEADPGADIEALIVDLVGGNPLYAEQYVRLLLERDLLVRATEGLRLPAGVDLPLPETVQAVLVARLDTLPAEHKALLCDAAVIGETFWSGGVAALSGREASAVDKAMAVLAARDLVRPVLTSTLEGESEYLFWHALTRDVAYGQLPRKVRARKHEETALWIERQAGERGDEFVEILAHHHVAAHELAVATHEEALARETLDPALDCLVKAGRRADLLDPSQMQQLFGKARELAHEDHPLWLRVQLGWAGVLAHEYRMGEADALLEEIIPSLVGAGDTHAAAEAMMRQVACRSHTGGDMSSLNDAAVAVLEHEGPSRDLVDALVSQAAWGHLGPAGDPERTVELCERALAMARDLDMPPPVAALSFRAMARLELGREEALAEYEAATAECRAQGLKRETALQLFNYCSVVLAAKGVDQALTAVEDGLAFAREADVRSDVEAFRLVHVETLIHRGEWEAALNEACSLEPDLTAADDRQGLLEMRSWLVAVYSRRGDAARGRALAEQIVADAERLDLLAYLRTLTRQAAVVGYGPDDTPTAVWEALTSWTRERPTMGEPSYALLSPDVVRVALRRGDLPLAESVCESVPTTGPLYRHAKASGSAAVAEALGDHQAASLRFADAAARWRDFGLPYEEGQALLGEGRCLGALGRASEAAAPLAAAREIFTRLGARPALDETLAELEEHARA
jgi:class 3 adenylate cyclase/tetratricopeptide (TPR) repeat protein/energy-coupling factor transporter ATP-binding protein EcfA2